MTPITVLRSLSDRFIRQRQPSGYRPGETLAHVRRNFGGLSFEALEPTRGRFAAADGLFFEAQERTHSELLMHLVLTDFVLQVPSREVGALQIELRHTGAVRRTGLTCKRRAGEAAALAALEAALLHDQPLCTALMPLDFKRLVIERGEAGGWTVSLEHMGASEVVNRMPSFRRYIRLDDRQRDGLLQSLSALQRILQTL
ncbi:DUF3156 family protein [Pseudomonas putida]|uniref:DUF3156 family protein n=1 Tax=Pseudomonas putida TaxID=303 RepID=UPI0023634215|nr:DUF3156 family protein [Pseudomonas putida]MDD2054241.1 DUF3156 family protein [Pseudomonas putida]